MTTGTCVRGFPGACGQTNDGDGDRSLRPHRRSLGDRAVLARTAVQRPVLPVRRGVDEPATRRARTRATSSTTPRSTTTRRSACGPTATTSRSTCSRTTGSRARRCARWTARRCSPATRARRCSASTRGRTTVALLASDVDGKTMPPAGAPNYLVDARHPDQPRVLEAPRRLHDADQLDVQRADQHHRVGVRPAVRWRHVRDRADRRLAARLARRSSDEPPRLPPLRGPRVAAVQPLGHRGRQWRRALVRAADADAPTVFQQGTYAPDGAFRWMPSVAMDGSGDIAAIFTVSSSTINPSIRYTARKPSDPPGTLGAGEGTIVAGAARRRRSRGGATTPRSTSTRSTTARSGARTSTRRRRGARTGTRGSRRSPCRRAARSRSRTPMPRSSIRRQR